MEQKMTRERNEMHCREMISMWEWHINKQLSSDTIREMRNVMMRLANGEVGTFVEVLPERGEDANQRRTAKLMQENAPTGEQEWRYSKAREEWEHKDATYTQQKHTRLKQLDRSHGTSEIKYAIAAMFKRHLQPHAK